MSQRSSHVLYVRKQTYGRLNDHSRHKLKCCEKFNVKIVDGIVVQKTGKTSEDDVEPLNIRRNLFPSEQLASGKGPNQKSVPGGILTKKTVQTPEQLFPMEKVFLHVLSLT